MPFVVQDSLITDCSIIKVAHLGFFFFSSFAHGEWCRKESYTRFSLHLSGWGKTIFSKEKFSLKSKKD